MAFITPKELETHLYKENIEAISREDETILTAAIDAALQEAYGYLGAYDRKKIFSFACRHVDVCDLQLRQDRYERAVAWLRQVQKSDIKPNLPIIDEDGDGKPDTAGEYIYGSNPKRNQHF